MALGLRFTVVSKPPPSEPRAIAKASVAALARWGADTKQRLRAQLTGVVRPGRGRGRGQNILATWRDQIFADQPNPAARVKSTVPAIINLLAEGGLVRPRQARRLVIPLPGAVALGLDRLYSDRGGGLRFRKAADLESAIKRFGKLRVIPRPNGDIILAVEPQAFRAGGGRGRFARRKAQLIPLFLLARELSFVRKIDPERIAGEMFDAAQGYLDEEFERAGL